MVTRLRRDHARHCENDYGKDLFSRADFTTLAALLAKVKGQFILSLNDTPGVREVFEAFNLEKVKTRYSVGAIKNQQVGELLITNFTARLQRS